MKKIYKNDAVAENGEPAVEEPVKENLQIPKELDNEYDIFLFKRFQRQIIKEYK